MITQWEVPPEMTVRELLPPWKVWSANIDMSPEPPETFEWITDPEMKKYLTDARTGLDSIGGSRKWLKDYIAPKGRPSYFDGIGPAIMRSFGSYHSGASASLVGWKYKYLLNNWEEFVKKTKLAQARDAYYARQITWSEVREYARKTDFTEFRAKYPNNYTDDEIVEMLISLSSEYYEKQISEEAEELEEKFQGKLGVLEFLYEHPTRWDDSERGCSLFGLPSYISDRMMVEMEKRIPGYGAHIDTIKAARTRDKKTV